MRHSDSMRYVENEDVVGAAPTGDAPITSESEWWTSLLSTRVCLILGVERYYRDLACWQMPAFSALQGDREIVYNKSEWNIAVSAHVPANYK